jgi:UDP-N-acetylmuramyl-tripeptide synthetase
VKLSSLLKTIEPFRKNGIKAEFPGHNDVSNPEISSIHYRAQSVKPGGLFVAIQGLAADGHDFIDEALQKGARVIVTQRPVQKKSIIVEVNDSRKALATLSAQFYGNPSEDLILIGITGTNGKTTTAYLVESILIEAGFKVGVIGTVNYRWEGKIFESPVTTPESLDLQRILAQMQRNRVTHIVLEVSSHALDLHRVEKCWLDIGVFTNLTQDHLDYHKDMKSYWSCKKRLFTEHLTVGPKKRRAAAVINCDDAKGQELFKMLTVTCLSTGHAPDSMIRPHFVKQNLSGTAGQISIPAGVIDFESQLVGKYNLENILVATGVGVALNISPAHIKTGIEHIRSIPGRLEPVPNDNGWFVYVDYAHTPDALKNVLSALSTMTDKKIICVFGCGGDRDKQKRPQMGKIAAKLCDLSIITSDNPRSEIPMEIINHILQGTEKVCSKEYQPSELIAGFNTKGYTVEPDRKKAIRLGIAASQPGDTVLIAGKGHETYQILGENIIPFDDRKEAEQALSERFA